MDQANRLRNMVGGHKTDAIAHSEGENIDVERKRENPSVRVISVTSGKGGVGKTNVVANLALALCKMERKVLILDADLGLGNMDVLLGLNPRFTMKHVFSGEKRLSDILVYAPGGFYLLPAASGIQDLTDLSDSQRLFLLNELDMFQNTFDVLLIDTGAGISANVMYFNFAAMEKVVVVTNEPASLTDAYALIKVLTNKYKQKRFQILVNAAHDVEEADRIYRHLTMVVDKFLGAPSLDYLGFIPFDPHIHRAVRRQQTVLELYPHTRASKSFMEVAERLLSYENQLVFEGDIKFFWQRLLNYQEPS
jgi:flagellar biosynthesis protein FlhG